MALLAINAIEYTTPGSYTWNVPFFNTGFIFITASGAGGGGGLGASGGNVQAGGGGGAGQSCQGQVYKVTPGGTVAIVVGAGGVSNSIATKALYPWVANVGATTDADFAEGTRNGGFGGGDGGGMTSVGTLRFLPGAGAAYGGDGGSGGTGGGPLAYKKGAAPHGNMGFRVGNQGGPARTDTTPKDSNRYFSGSGGGAGSKGLAASAGGAGAVETFNTAGTAGAGNLATNTDGAGGGAASMYGDGGNGGAGGSVGTSASGGPGAGGGGSGGVSAGTSGAAGSGTDGYVLLTWYEYNPA